MTDEPTVLRVFDATDPMDRALYVSWPPLMDWIREHDAEPNNVRRIEVLLLDCPLVRFHEFVRDDDGRLQVVELPDGDRAVSVVTRDVLARRMPPERQAVA